MLLSNASTGCSDWRLKEAKPSYMCLKLACMSGFCRVDPHCSASLQHYPMSNAYQTSLEVPYSTILYAA